MNKYKFGYQIDPYKIKLTPSLYTHDKNEYTTEDIDYATSELFRFLQAEVPWIVVDRMFDALIGNTKDGWDTLHQFRRDHPTKSSRLKNENLS